ncbi:hypothetical protein TWF225_005377 [Orbilia oligospora]|nr:hypothetical protein TWF225_005377 [Orbilia oligospora]KAF3257449.1 hypothetical protein TWF128_005009 [Orbilia oligospora]KAF3270696.1 hypothetical protein TWF217_006974 [Orbilia oligospora]KAF3295266.1 hypothetical protein TWF132_001963 [Orbilia oligospora]
MTGTIVQNDKSYRDSESRAAAVWNGKLDKSRVNLALACEGHVRGYSFLTLDGNFRTRFKEALGRKCLTSYVVTKKDLLK